MKIAYFLDIPQGLGGAGNVLLEQARIMSKIHDVIVIIPCSKDGKINPEYERRCINAGLTYKGLYYNTAFYPQYIDLVTVKQVLPRIKQFIFQENIEFLHSVQLNIAVELASREMNVPHLMNAYSLRKEEFILRDKSFLPRYHSCDSLLYCRLWSQEAQMESRCIRPSAQLEEIREKRREKRELRILMLGDICRYKNQLAAIQSVENCYKRGKKIYLTIAGDASSPYAHSCRNYVKQNKLSGLVSIIGFQSKITPLLDMHDCLMCTSTRESFPSSIVEAMTYDMTIISTPVAGVPELLTNGENAYISSGFSVEEITTSIIECREAYQNGKIEKIHQHAKITWNENFTPQIVKEKLNEYYCHILEEFYVSEHSHTGREKIIFGETADIYKILVEAHTNEIFILQRCYYYAFLKKNLHPGKAYIWGAGNYGETAKQLSELLFGQVKILAYVDIKKKGEYLGYPVIQPEAVRSDIDYIFLAFDGEHDSVVEYLEKKGFQYNRNIWILP